MHSYLARYRRACSCCISSTFQWLQGEAVCSGSLLSHSCWSDNLTDSFLLMDLRRGTVGRFYKEEGVEDDKGELEKVWITSGNSKANCRIAL